MSTTRTLDLKQPRPVAIVQQANIGTAVQVNNNAGVTAIVEKPPDELLGSNAMNGWTETVENVSRS